MAYVIKEYRKGAFDGAITFDFTCYHQKVSRKTEALKIASEVASPDMYILDVIKPSGKWNVPNDVIIRYKSGVITHRDNQEVGR